MQLALPSLFSWKSCICCTLSGKLLSAALQTTLMIWSKKISAIGSSPPFREGYTERDISIMMGDLNATILNDDTGMKKSWGIKDSEWWTTMERHIKDRMASIAREWQRKRWAEYFGKLLNRPAPDDPVDIQPASHNLPIVCTVPMEEEIWKAIIQLENGKAAGPDDIPAEALKVDISKHPWRCFTHFSWNCERRTKCRRSGKRDILSSFKKGDLRPCSKLKRNSIVVHPW